MQPKLIRSLSDSLQEHAWSPQDQPRSAEGDKNPCAALQGRQVIKSNERGPRLIWD
eukprot:jgi/Botrbrau1/4401/Bobra.105_2s0044.2